MPNTEEPSPNTTPVCDEESSSTIGCSGCVFVIVLISSLSIILVLALGRAREAARRTSCQGMLTVAYWNLRVVAEKHEQYLPRLERGIGNFTFSDEWLEDSERESLHKLLCPSVLPHEQEKVSALDRDFVYLGSSVATMEEARKLFDCHLKQIDPESSSGIRPLNLDDPQAENIPVLIERPGHHPPRGGNVVFLDGRCRYLKMGEAFPMIEEFFRQIDEVETPSSIK